MPNPSRRSVLIGTTATVAASGLGPLGCGSPDAPFPQGVASGDPTPTTVLLWTRCPGPDRVKLRWELATDQGFTDVVATGSVVAEPAGDHTVRVRVTGLTPGRTWWYRFHGRHAWSRTGRTRTAPAPGDDRAATVAWASCQDYPGRWFHAWRALLDHHEDPDLVLFLGDVIYETTADRRYQDPVPGRAIELPDGAPLHDDPENPVAVTLEDYREIYRVHATDPDYQEARARWPFVVMWDDHEFANDAWQDHANEYDGARGDEQQTSRREAATRAFWEHQPLDLPLRDRPFPDDLALYRSLRWGALVEVFLCDLRTWRDDHLVPESAIVPEVGKLIEDTPLGSRIFAVKEGFDALEAEVRPTMLGPTQKAWLIDGIRGSDAAWKVWASPLMVSQLLVDLRDNDLVPGLFRQRFVFKPDQWDGFRSERAEIVAALADVADWLVLSGDLHGFYAAQVHVDFDAPEAVPRAAELLVSSISASHLAEQLDRIPEQVPMLAEMGLEGLGALADPVILASNPHIRYARSDAHGIAVARFTDRSVVATFLEIDAVGDPAYPGVARTQRFELIRGSTVLTSG